MRHERRQSLGSAWRSRCSWGLLCAHPTSPARCVCTWCWRTACALVRTVHRSTLLLLAHPEGSVQPLLCDGCAHRCLEAKSSTQLSRCAWPWGGGAQLRPSVTPSPLVELWYCHYVLGPPLGSEARLYGPCTVHTPMVGKCRAIKPAPLPSPQWWELGSARNQPACSSSRSSG